MIDINGTEYEAKSLSMPQVRKCRAAEVDEADVLAIAWSCGITPDMVRPWFNEVSAGVAADAIQQVFEASGLLEGAQKSS